MCDEAGNVGGTQSTLCGLRKRPWLPARDLLICCDKGYCKLGKMPSVWCKKHSYPSPRAQQSTWPYDVSWYIPPLPDWDLAGQTRVLGF